MTDTKIEQSQIDDVMNRVAEKYEEGGSKYPGMSYEQGIMETLLWLFENGDHPYKD